MSARPAATLLLLSSILLACHGDSPVQPTAGTIRFTITTTGVDLDADGYSLSVDGVSQAVPANGVASWVGAAGTHAIALDGLALNCDATSTTTSASVTLGATTAVDLRVSCGPYLSNVIVFTTDGPGSDVLVMRPDGSRRGYLTTDHAVYAGPAVSPDGQTIAVASQAGGVWNGIYLLDRFGKSRTKLAGRGDDSSPDWSPDGRMIVFESQMAGPYGDYGRIWIVARDGTGLRQLTPETDIYTSDAGPSWSPDGTKIVFSRSGELYTILPDGTGLTDLGIPGGYPAWSPDGGHLTFEGWANNQQSLFVADADGRNMRQLVQPVQADLQPQWSPDGREIVFERLESNVLQIYRVSADGTGLTKLSSAARNESSPVWTRVLSP